MNEKFCILIQISLKFFPKGAIDNKLVLVLWLGAEQATSHYLNQYWPSSRTRICSTWGRWINFNQNRTTCLSTINIVAADDLMVQGTMASAASLLIIFYHRSSSELALTYFAWNISGIFSCQHGENKQCILRFLSFEGDGGSNVDTRTMQACLMCGWIWKYGMCSNHDFN